MDGESDFSSFSSYVDAEMNETTSLDSSRVFNTRGQVPCRFDPLPSPQLKSACALYGVHKKRQSDKLLSQNCCCQNQTTPKMGVCLPIRRTTSLNSSLGHFLYKNPEFSTSSSSLVHDTHRDNQPVQMPKQKSRNCGRKVGKRAGKNLADDFKMLNLDSSDSQDSKRSNAALKFHNLSTKSGIDLRAVVRSQIRMQEILRDSISQMNEYADKLVLEDFVVDAPSLGLMGDNEIRHEIVKKLTSTMHLPLEEIYMPCAPQQEPQVKHQVVAQVNAQVEPPFQAPAQPKIEFKKVKIVNLETEVKTKVIMPLIQRIQRVYLENMQEQLRLLTYLEGLPAKLNDIFEGQQSDKQAEAEKENE
ncbi:hypothetical protein KR222_005273 [Zaprionus bogoriensis]|nr:hypothetical protein KR222_005273 [Zaprionus bogoriensis]